MSASAQASGNSTAYSVVHISDTQYLASLYPETYDYTFSYLDSIKERYNISAIIITGDLVETWNDKKEWEAYSHAVNKTSIPVFVVAGNHDINDDYDYQYYTQYTGNTKNTSVTSFENFDLVGINSVYESLTTSGICIPSENPVKFLKEPHHYCYALLHGRKRNAHLTGK